MKTKNCNLRRYNLYLVENQVDELKKLADYKDVKHYGVLVRVAINEYIKRNTNK